MILNTNTLSLQRVTERFTSLQRSIKHELALNRLRACKIHSKDTLCIDYWFRKYQREKNAFK